MKAPQGPDKEGGGGEGDGGDVSEGKVGGGGLAEEWGEVEEVNGGVI
jgi:hypothetical protein